MKTNYLQKALRVWTQADHSQSEFARTTGIEQSICSRIFAGTRGFTKVQRLAVYNGFQKIDLQQAMIFLKADLEDQTPENVRKYLRFSYEIPASRKEKSSSKGNRVSEAKKTLISRLEAGDPAALSVALALQDWSARP